MEEDLQQTPGASEIKNLSDRPQWVDDLLKAIQGCLEQRGGANYQSRPPGATGRDGVMFAGSVISQATFDETVSRVMENQQILQPLHPLLQPLHGFHHPHLEAQVHKLHLFQQM